jgi:hypothetical protein
MHKVTVSTSEQETKPSVPKNSNPCLLQYLEFSQCKLTDGTALNHCGKFWSFIT